MPLLDILKAGSPILKQKAVAVTKVSTKIRDLIQSMTETMYAADGVGLAAPQVGVSQRIIVVDAGDGLLCLINPVIIKAEGKESNAEGCLSVPGIYGDVERYTHVVVEALDPKGKIVRIAAEGLLARVLQHEMDHLEGVLFIDRANTIYKGKN